MSTPSSTIDPRPATTRAPRLRVAARVGAAVLGGYAFTWGLIALATALLSKAGMGFHDADEDRAQRERQNGQRQIVPFHGNIRLKRIGFGLGLAYYLRFFLE